MPKEDKKLAFLTALEETISQRKANFDEGKPNEGSYTASLFEKGINKIAQKVGEEAVELIIEAKDNNDELFKAEAADLMYHLLVLFAAKGISVNDIIEVLQSRHQ